MSWGLSMKTRMEEKTEPPRSAPKKRFHTTQWKRSPPTRLSSACML